MTAQTVSYLTGTLLATGQAAGSITPTRMQDIPDSFVPWDDPANASGLGAPAILRGTVNLSLVSGITYGTGVVLATRQANATALQAACDYCAAAGKFLEAPPGTIEIDNTTGILWDTSNYNSFVWRGTLQSIISQFHSNAPGLVIANSVQLSAMDVEGLSLRYGASQASQAGAVTLQLGYMWKSYFRRIVVGQIGASASTNYPAKALRIYSATGGASFFSNSLRDIAVQGAQTSLFSKEIQGTGNVFQNMYLTNTVGDGSATAITSPFVINSGGGADTENVFEQLNIEWTSANIIMNLNVAQAQSFISAHFEGNVLTGTAPKFCYLGGGAQATFIGCDWYNNQILAANLTSQPSIIGFGAAGPSALIGCIIQDATGGNVDTPFLVFRPDGGSTFVPIATAENLLLSGLGANVQMDGTLAPATYGTIDQVGGYSYPVVFGRTRRTRITNPSGSTVTLYGSAGEEVYFQYTSALTAAVTLVLAAIYAPAGSRGTTITRPAGHQVWLHIPANITSATNTLTIKNLTSAGTTLATLNTTAASDTYYLFDGTNWTKVT